MFNEQKKMLKAIAKNDKLALHYFPRQIGKTYIRNYLKKLGEVAAPINSKETK